MVDYEANEVGKVDGLGIIYQVHAPLHKQILALNKKGVEHPSLVSPEETGLIRLAGLSNDWTRTSMAPIAVKGENQILYRVSPFMHPLMAEHAVKFHASGNYPTLNRVFYEIAKETAKAELGLEPEDRTAHILSNRGDYGLTPEMDDARFILGRITKKYFEKFNQALRTTDILWTKPSELSFYSGLGIPLIIAPSIGSQEDYNRRWLLSTGSGIVQENPKYADQWLFDYLESGRFAKSALRGFIEINNLGAYNIRDVIFKK